MRETGADQLRHDVIQHLSHGRLEEGQQLLEMRAAQMPEAARLECLGTLHFYRREMQEAVRCYEAAIRLDPDRVIARYQYLVGIQDEREGNLANAFRRYQAAIEAEPVFVDPYVDLGALLMKVNDLEGAATCYRDAVRLAPSEVANHLNLLTALRQLAARDPDRYGGELSNAEAAYAVTFQS